MFLNNFIDKILLQHPTQTKTALQEEFQEAAMLAVREFFDQETKILASWLPEWGEVKLELLMTLRITVHNPKTELPLLLAKKLPEVDDIMDGDDLVFLIGHLPTQAEQTSKTKDIFGDAWLYDWHPTRLSIRLDQEYSKVIFRYLPHEAFPVGTLGHLLAEGGLSMCGLAATFAETTLCITKSIFEFSAATENFNTIKFGFSCEVSRGAMRVQIELEKTDNLPNRLSLFNKKVEVNSEAVKSVLLLLAQKFEAYVTAKPENPPRWALNGYVEIEPLLYALLLRPKPDSFVAWCQTSLRADSFAPIEVTYKKYKIVLTPEEYCPPEESTSSMSSILGFSVSIEPPAALDLQWGSPWMYLGFLEDDSLETPGPKTAAELAYVQLLLEQWREYVRYYVEYFLKKAGLDSLSASYWQYNMPSFRLLDLLAYRIAHGAPPPPPVPAFSAKELGRAGSVIKAVTLKKRRELLKALSQNTSKPFAMYDLSGYTIILADELTRCIPFYAHTILLQSPDSKEFITVLMCDVWNPQAARVIDGDAFALRRFLEWLRAGIKKAKLDQEILFSGTNVADDDEEDKRESTILVSDWLLFNEPKPKEEHLVDWRCQHYLVNAGQEYGTIGFAPIYGFRTEHQRRVIEQDIPTWRRFLREVIDPRFGASACFI
jgi:hypothetical protein